LVVGISTVADARPAADAVTVETPVGYSAKPTMTVSDGWKPLAASSMSSPVPRVSLVIEAMVFGRNSLIVDDEGSVLVVVVTAVVEVVDAVVVVVLGVAVAVVVEAVDVLDVVDVVEDVVDVLDVVDDVEVDDEPDEDATGVPLTAFEATESPTALTALIVTEYAVPFVRPVMVNGLVVDAGERAV
jgi:hypothetical protein